MKELSLLKFGSNWAGAPHIATPLAIVALIFLTHSKPLGSQPACLKTYSSIQVETIVPMSVLLGVLLVVWFLVIVSNGTEFTKSL